MKRPITVMKTVANMLLITVSLALAGSGLPNCSAESASMPHGGDSCCPHHQPASNPVKHCPQSVCVSADTDPVAVVNAAGEESGKCGDPAPISGLAAQTDGIGANTLIPAPAAAAPPNWETVRSRFTVLRI